MIGPMTPLAGLQVVEVALGVSAVGAGLASSLPGSLLRDLGADVNPRVQSRRRPRWTPEWSSPEYGIGARRSSRWTTPIRPGRRR